MIHPNIFGRFLTKQNIVCAAIFILVGFFIGSFSGFKDYLYAHKNAGDLINYRSEVKYPIEKYPTENPVIRDKISELIDDKINKGQATSISVYFRNFDKGEWSGVNEDVKYSPASLFKVPQMIAYFKIAQVDPNILNNQIRYASGPDRNSKESIRPSESLKPGTYAVDELIKRMIIYSDNNAQDLLQQNIDKNFYNESYTDLGLPLPFDRYNFDYMSPKAYSIVFRTLYNSSYLNKTMSEKALQFLSSTEFHKGLVADLPSTIKVAHKFGERAFGIISSDDNIISNIRELHDCGIVYLPDNTYNICIMTKGRDLNKLESVISQISRAVYDEVVKMKK